MSFMCGAVEEENEVNSENNHVIDLDYGIVFSDLSNHRSLHIPHV